jgi:hypothetical protein
LECRPDDFERLKNTRPWRREHAEYVNIHYDDTMLILAAGEILGGLPMPSGQEAYNKCIERLKSMNPNVRLPNGTIEEHERHVHPSEGWPKTPDSFYRHKAERRFACLGRIRHKKAEVEEKLRRLKVPFKEWVRLPPDLIYANEFSLEHYNYRQTVNFWRWLGLEPRYQQTIEQVVAGIDAACQEKAG